MNQIVNDTVKERIAIYPGSFDPITNGHLDIIKRSLGIFDKIIIAVAVNAGKKAMFSPDERRALISEVMSDELKEDSGRVEVDAFDGLTIEYAKKRNACAILRGLRAVADFEYELQMANMNRKLSSTLETVFMMTSEKWFFVSSRNVKEVAVFGGDITELVPPNVAATIYDKIKK